MFVCFFVVIVVGRTPSRDEDSQATRPTRRLLGKEGLVGDMGLHSLHSVSETLFTILEDVAVVRDNIGVGGNHSRGVRVSRSLRRAVVDVNLALGRGRELLGGVQGVTEGSLPRLVLLKREWNESETTVGMGVEARVARTSQWDLLRLP